MGKGDVLLSCVIVESLGVLGWTGERRGCQECDVLVSRVDMGLWWIKKRESVRVSEAMIVTVSMMSMKGSDRSAVCSSLGGVTVPLG